MRGPSTTVQSPRTPTHVGYMCNLHVGDHTAVGITGLFSKLHRMEIGYLCVQCSPIALFPSGVSTISSYLESFVWLLWQNFQWLEFRLVKHHNIRCNSK